MQESKNILFVFGTRPEIIKIAPIIEVLKMEYAGIKPIICFTGQHKELAEQALFAFNINPDLSLSIMDKVNNLSELTSAILAELQKVLHAMQPDLVLVHGDTTSAMAASLAAFYNNIPIAHVEAGLRTNDILSPFPEEFNRQLISKVAKFHFAPTIKNAEVLQLEGVKKEHIYVTGNTVVDALKTVCKKISQNQTLEAKIKKSLNEKLSFPIEKTKFLLITSHRRENFGKPIRNICNALKEIAENFENVELIFPVHLNPNIRGEVEKRLGNMKNIHLIEPVDYFEFTYLMQNCYLIISDSGGIQEEAPSLNKPLLVTRDVTERQEIKDLGGVKLVGSNKKVIVETVIELLENPEVYRKMQNKKNPFASENSSKIITDIIADYINQN